MRSRHPLQLTSNDREKLDRLIGAAILDSTVYERLIDRQDTALFDEYELSQVTRALICTVRASTLTELADAIVSFEERFAVTEDDSLAYRSG